jgi:hypothetical protein
VDGTLVDAHSPKQGAAGTSKGGFGFDPLVAYLDRGDGTGEAWRGSCGRATPAPPPPRSHRGPRPGPGAAAQARPSAAAAGPGRHRRCHPWRHRPPGPARHPVLDQLAGRRTRAPSRPGRPRRRLDAGHRRRRPAPLGRRGRRAAPPGPCRLATEDPGDLPP